MSCKNLSEKSEEEYDLEDLEDYSQQLWNKGKFMGRAEKFILQVYGSFIQK